MINEIKAKGANQTAYEKNNRIPALLETIEFLKKQEKLPPMKWSIGQSYSCRDHVLDQTKDFHLGPGHVGNDGSEPWDRMERYG